MSITITGGISLGEGLGITASLLYTSITYGHNVGYKIEQETFNK